ncbi:MAG: hypothetical protein RQ936_02585 [Gammaproteobacteria bacterium]|nr:hypothetical protein [Gammaproteobacteria bacterium]
MHFELMDFSIIGLAFIAGFLVLATHVPLGMVVLQRGIIFIDLAIAQMASVGMIYAYTLIDESNTFSIQLIATLSAILGAIFLRWTERRWPDIQEAIIGVSFVVSACVGILLLAYLCGLAGYIAGLLISTLADLPSSPTIVLSLTACVILHPASPACFVAQSATRTE